MTRADFERMIRRMSREVPAEYFDGVTEVVVSPRAVPHPDRDGVFTLGECVPLPMEDDTPRAIQSRVVLYHGSFLALSALDEAFDWEAEGWETLTHELRHHVEWRAREDSLESADWATEQNFARQDGETFDPLFFLDGDSPGPDQYHIDGDVFLDHLVRQAPRALRFLWRQRPYQVTLPPGTTIPVYLVVDGVAEPPAGELILVLRRRPRLWDLFRPRTLRQEYVQAEADTQPEVG